MKGSLSPSSCSDAHGQVIFVHMAEDSVEIGESSSMYNGKPSMPALSMETIYSSTFHSSTFGQNTLIYSAHKHCPKKYLLGLGSGFHKIAHKVDSQKVCMIFQTSTIIVGAMFFIHHISGDRIPRTPPFLFRICQISSGTQSSS